MDKEKYEKAIFQLNELIRSLLIDSDAVKKGRLSYWINYWTKVEDENKEVFDIVYTYDPEMWRLADDRPDEDKRIIVRDIDGNEYDNHYWCGHCYYDFIEYEDGHCDGYRSQVDIVEWKYDNRDK